MTVEGTKWDIDLKVDKKTFKEFVDKKVVDQGENFINKLKASEKNKDKTKLENYKETFNKIGKETLRVIWKDMADNFHTIDITNKKAPKLQTYIEAKKAFEEDIQTLGIVDVDMKTMLEDIQKFIDLKQINTQTDWTKITSSLEWLKEKASDPKINIPDQWNHPKWVMDWIIVEIDKRINFIKEEKNKALGVLLDSTPSFEISQELFDKNKIAREALIAKNRKNTDTNKGDQQLNYEKLLWFYWNTAWITSITWYECRKLPNTQDDYIQITWPWADGKNIKQDIKLWSSTDVLHRARAEAYKWDAKRSDGESIQDNLNQLDSKWSYAQFENILKWQTEPVKFLSWLLGKNLLEGINTNKPKSDAEAKTNRYYGVILDYIVSIKNEWLLTTYLNHVVVGNAIQSKYLWTNRENQRINFNKITDKWTIEPTSNNGKLLTQIRLQLAQNTSPKNFQETLSKWLDSLIDAFWPMLFSILKMFGFGKWSLLKMFPWAKDKINNIYKKEYDLSEKQIDSINTIIETDFENTPLRTDKLPSTKELQKGFKDKKNSYDTYITKIANNVKYVNISIFQNWLNTYNKDNKKEININDIVNIDTDATTKKQTITTIKDEGMFQSVMGSILASENTRWRVAAANQEIQVERKEKNIGTWFDEQGLEVGKDKESARYLISTQKDIARYLTASLFSNKDLAYVMTENELHNYITVKEQKKEGDNKTPETPKETLILKDEKTDFTNGAINKVWAKKAIHDIIDMANKPPMKIQITRKDWKTITIGTLKEDYIDDRIKTPIKTYIDDKWKRVITSEWDKISLPETVDTPEQKFTKNRDKMNWAEGLKKIWSDKKYGTLDISKFTYKKDESNKDILAYKDNILTSLETIFTDNDQYPLLVNNLSDNGKKATYEWIFTDPIHLVNMLNTIDTRDNNSTKKYGDIINHLSKTWDTYKVTADKTKNTIAIESMTWTTKNWSVILSQDKNKLEAKREAI